MPTKNDATYRLLRAAQGNPVLDKRKRPYRKVPNRPYRPRPSKWERRKIVAWDGEGANLATGEHVYNLLANSFGKYIINHGGISTEECFRFMLAHSQADAINVIYGGSYDVNMILRDVPPDKIKKLWATGTCYWKQYGIHYAHRKKFTVSLYTRARGSKPIKSIILWDVLGYFQTTFVKACRKWLGEDFAGKLAVFDQIQEMKEQRSTFTTERIEDIVKYNYVECQMLVLLVEALFRAMDEAGIVLTRYDGAGSIAAALLRQNNILMHKGTVPKEVSDWSQYAYSGGRIEAPRCGSLEYGDVFRYDINSAYPSACLQLPSYAGCEWTFDSEWNGEAYSIVEVEWSYEDETPFYPLWYRRPDGSILYPQSGRGRYYGNEIEVLRTYYREGRDFEIIGSCNAHLATDAKPFTFLSHTYATRYAFKVRGSMAHEALKLGMNSVYGKLAQQAGYRNGRIPTYHHLLWAGQITSITRSKLYRAAMQHPDSIAAFATDAIISLREHDLSVGTGLGQWTPDKFTGVTLVQAGVYWLRLPTGAWTDKYRGFDAGSLRRETLVACWRRNETYTAKLTRFYGMGSAVGLNNFKDYWRVWRTEPRKLSITPDGKRQPGKDRSYADRLCVTVPTVNVYGDMLSTPYPLEWGLLAGKKLRETDADGVDIRIMEEEMMDSYA